jgi:hypothetical protein
MGKPGKTSMPEATVSRPPNTIHFNLTGLVIFSVILMAGAAFITLKMAGANRPKLAESFAVDPHDKSRSIHVGAWGELITRDIQLERPDEYLSGETTAPTPEKWVFAGTKPDVVRTLLAGYGVDAGKLAGAFKAGVVTETTAATEFQPPADFVFSLTPASREKLYLGLAGKNVNIYFDYPFVFPDGIIDSVYADPRLQADDVALLKKLVYANGSANQLTDYQTLMRTIPTVERRTAMARVLSRQSAVFAGLVIKPDTDIDKIAAYWGHTPNVRFTDIRPLLEALKALPEGGNLSLFYLLPKFARDRLYTFPLPSGPGDPIMDCHWSTFNFASDTPDNRFDDPSFAIEHIRNNYYNIAAPSICGDVLLLMNDKDEIKHSAVYLADDLVFTKNGNNYSQPWMIMHIHDLLSFYPASPPMRTIYMRRKVD